MTNKFNRHLDKYAWSVIERVFYTRPGGQNPWMGEVTTGEISQTTLNTLYLKKWPAPY
jgi:hypothetical protein